MSCNRSIVYTVRPGDISPTTSMKVEDFVKNKKIYNGKKVKLMGYFHYGLEEASISGIKDDFPKGIWIEFDYDKQLLDDNDKSLFEGNKLVEYSNKKVIIIGEFVAGKKGHLSQYNGALTNISYFSCVQ